MSLINEALKKARRAQPAASTASTPALSPVEPLRNADNGGLWLPLLIGVTLLTSAILLWQWFASGRADVVRARSTPAALATVTAPAVRVQVPTEATAPPPAPAPRPVPVPPAVADAKATVTNTLAAVPEPSATTNKEVIDPPKPPPITYKLQGIFYRPTNPSAVIDGKLVFVGSRVADARVILIEKDATTIVTSAGQTNLLELP